MKKRYLLLLFWITGYVLNTMAGNRVDSYTVNCNPDLKPDFSVGNPTLSNTAGLTQIGIQIKSVLTPFEIYKVEWINRDTALSPLSPFTLTIPADSIKGKAGTWQVLLEFDYKDTFATDDEVRIHSDRGTISIPMSSKGKFKREMQLLQREYEEKLNLSQSETDRAWHMLALVLCCVAAGSVAIGLVIRCRLVAKQKQLKEMAILMTERTNRNRELENKVDDLYRSRLDTLNMLCNEYFEKNDSEKIRLTLYNEVEKQILHLRDKESLEELETIVNTYLDNILVKVRQQLPELKTTDLHFLIYLFAGFSPRAVCIFSDIKIKNFYNRRSRLKERILSSEAPDREWFVSKM